MKEIWKINSYTYSGTCIHWRHSYEPTWHSALRRGLRPPSYSEWTSARPKVSQECGTWPATSRRLRLASAKSLATGRAPDTPAVFVTCSWMWEKIDVSWICVDSGVVVVFSFFFFFSSFGDERDKIVVVNQNDPYYHIYFHIHIIILSTLLS